MSQFIDQGKGGQFEAPSGQILKPMSRQIVIPRVSGTGGVSQGEGHKKMLKIMFFQIKNAEFDKLRHQNAVSMQKQFEQLKSKLARRVHNSSSVQKAMSNEKLPKIQLSQIIRLNPQKVDLMKQYRSKINGKLHVLRQAENISKEKLEYQKWYDTQKNSITKSPIFSKMAFLLQKVGKKQNTLPQTLCPNKTIVLTQKRYAAHKPKNKQQSLRQHLSCLS